MALRDVYKKYDNAEHYSVVDSSLEVTDREFIIFVGPSGYDKSTILRMIAGSKDITESELSIGDKVMGDIAPKGRGIAMVFQNYALYPHTIVFDNMAPGLKLRKHDRAEVKKRVEDVADILGLTGYLQRKPVALSGGQRQRVVPGQAIVRDAKVLLMDESLLNLDAKPRVVMRTETAKLHQRLETTTVYVAHNQTEVMIMADQIVIMKDGSIQQIGSPKEVHNIPKSMFVVGFIGPPVMNLFKVALNNGVVSSRHSLKLAIPEGRNKELVEHDYEGKKLTSGTRPEDVHSEQVVLTTVKDAVIESEVVVSELLGAESMFYTKIGNTEFTPKVDVRDFHHPGEMIDLAFDIDKRHLFDLQTEEVIK